MAERAARRGLLAQIARLEPNAGMGDEVIAQMLASVEADR